MRKRLLSLMAALSALAIIAGGLVLTGPANATGPPYPVIEGPSSFCPELTGTFALQKWNLSETGGTTSVEAHTGDPAKTLKVTQNAAPGNPAYTNQVTLGGGSALAHNHGLMTTDSNNFNPGTRDFFVCTGFQLINDTDGYNMTQWGTSNGNDDLPGCNGGTTGQVKLTGWYVKVQGTLGCAKPANTFWYDSGGVKHTIASTNLNGTGWHEVGIVRHGAHVSAYFDHVFQNTVAVDIGSVNMSGSADRMSVLCKYMPSGNYPSTYTHDCMDGKIAWVEAGIAGP